MAFIKPFKALHYNKDRIRDLSLVVAPPYDIIPPKLQDELYRVHPHNIVRLILGRIKKGDDKNNNRYTRAKRFFEAWTDSGIITRDPFPAVYIYSQVYRQGGRLVDRTGFIALMDLGADKDTKVLPHENTLAAPKTDRLNLMRETSANLSPIFVLYDDKAHEVMRMLKRFSSKNRPMIRIDKGGVKHSVWKMDDECAISEMAGLMKGKDIFIADGHHRFETARNYWAQIQSKDVPADVKRDAGYMMVYFVESDERILSVLPTHRLVKDIGPIGREEILKRLERYFTVESFGALGKLMLRLGRLSGLHAFGMYLGRNEFYILKLKRLSDSGKAIKNKPKDWKRLDVSILHLFVLQHVLGIRDEDDNIDFVKDPKEAVSLVNKNKFEMAFFLNPTKVSQVKRIAKIGEKMPRKATYFYPKPLSGLVINKFGD